MVTALIVAGVVLVAAVATYTVWLNNRNTRDVARLVADGKLHPGDVALLRMACRAGLPLHRWPDGRLRLTKPPETSA